MNRLLIFATIQLLLCGFSQGRPVVRNIRSTHEFDRLLQKHATETGLPVIVDFYSDSCGPCRMMAPIFKKVAADFVDTAVFVKIDTNAQYELSSRYQIRSLPTFSFFLHGNKVHQAMGGIGEASLRQETQSLVRQSQAENVILPLERLQEYYKQVDPSKAARDIQAVHEKCGAKTKKECVGAAATSLARKLKKKYGQALKLEQRFLPENQKAKNERSDGSSSAKDDKRRSPSSSSNQQKHPNLDLATKEQLMEELEKRLDLERDQEVEEEDADEEESDPTFARWKPGAFPERVVIVGGGPAGMAAAIYAARAGLSPLVIAPSMGGQLQGKGVDVENYPGLHNMTGPGVIASMRMQAAHFGAVFEDDMVTRIQVGSTPGSPLHVETNLTGIIATHTMIVATGADAKWLGVPGEYELRGGGVSSCATCDGFLFSGKHVLVVGGGDAAMEDALLLARTSRKVTLVHRRDRFRASKVLADRVKQHPLIQIVWNTTVKEIVGQLVEPEGGDDEESVDMDALQRVVKEAVLGDVHTGQESRLACDAVFVAIGHTPATSFLQGLVEFNPDHAGYVQTFGGSTATSTSGIFAAGDVSDAIYRQAITSAGSGAAAALDAERYLSEHGLGNEAADLEAELMAELLIGDDSPSANSYNAYEDAGGRFVGRKESLAAEL